MKEKERIIQAIKSLDFEALNNLLDDNRTYMDVSKALFLNTLKQNLEEYSNLNSYKKVVEGICGHCNKGCKAYKFKADNFPSLNLFFEENNGKVTDIYLCNALKIEAPDENDWDIYFSFYEEEKVNFTPTLKYHINIQKIDKAIKDFNKLESIGLVPILDVAHWYNKYKFLADELNLNDPFVNLKYKAYVHIDSIYSNVSSLVHNYNKNHLAQEALAIFKEIKDDDEKSIVKWLLENDNNYFFSLKKTENWKNTGILILETEPNLVIDCSDCLDSFLFEEIYNNQENEIMTKYEPTKEHYEQNGGSVTYSLKSFLKLHDKYSELL